MVACTNDMCLTRKARDREVFIYIRSSTEVVNFSFFNFKSGWKELWSLFLSDKTKCYLCMCSYSTVMESEHY